MVSAGRFIGDPVNLPLPKPGDQGLVALACVCKLLLTVVVLLGGVLAPLFLMLGLASTAGATATLLLNLEGLATMAIAWLVFGENVDRRLLLGAAAILAGAIILSWTSGPGGAGLGALAIAGACLCWGIDNNLTRKLSSVDPVQIAAVKGIVAGSANLLLAMSTGAHLSNIPPVLSAGLLGFFGYGVGLLLFRSGEHNSELQSLLR